MNTLRELTARHVRHGTLDGIVLRPARGHEAILVHEALAVVGRGLEGDRRAIVTAGRPKASRTRELTLFQAEHLPLLARWVGGAPGSTSACFAAT